MSRPLAFALALAVTAACLWYFLTPEVMEALGRALREARLLPIAAAFVLVGLVQWLRAWRFAVMTTERLSLPDWLLVRIALRLNFLNFILPFRLGELSYPVLMRYHYGHGLFQSAGILLLARIFDLATVLSILFGAAAVLRLWDGSIGALVGVGSVVFALAPFAILLIGGQLSALLRRLPKIGAIAEKLSTGLVAVANPQIGIASVVLSFVLWMTYGFAAFLVAVSVAPSVSAATALLGASAGNIAFALPVNGIAGIGPAQAAWVAATVRAGLAWDDAVVSALALHGVVLMNAIVLGTLGWLPDLARKSAARMEE